MKRKLSFVIILAGLIVLGGCQSEEAQVAPDAPQVSMQALNGAGRGEAVPLDGIVDGEAEAEGAVGLEQISASQTERRLIRTAEVTIEVKDARQTAETMTSEVKKLGGYVGDSTEELDALGVRTVTLQLRVPASRFDDLMKTISNLGTVLRRHVGTEDVTEEYVDVESRLRNLKRTEERLLEHLSKTARLADTLAVEKELSRVRMEIEQLEGRMRYLKHNIAFSTVTVTCKEKAKAGPAVPPESYSSGQVLSKAARSLVTFGRGLWTTLLWLLVWTPVWVPLVLVLRRLARRFFLQPPS